MAVIKNLLIRSSTFLTFQQVYMRKWQYSFNPTKKTKYGNYIVVCAYTSSFADQEVESFCEKAALDHRKTHLAHIIIDSNAKC